ncbi:serine/threonine protein kinase [Streptomyces cyaneogriseus subsp. noncyanogenus]|uniref:non-specific serine/threonine protein kinase n=1 Tax=Streptomyces cyaneogriseus subsp. noncyanogenus TaxID=477245 RepID=A0A0C5FYU0_9ACTN|nr:serine/threonine-protein kinase [Streptomyces cyaneogriseus]AJP02828.1 serine/threonine protein kinase [Streptomyces cyaneogriseus subsp. noncyanogenus]
MGEVFAGRYELVDPIGRGASGAVWRAWDHRRRRYVAAKVLQQSDAHALLRFVREQALRIDHPHVLAPASWAADDDKVLFTMDLVAGGSVAHLVGDYGPLPPAFACVLLDQLLSGLAAVHGEGVVHRDIKPANLLLEATGTGRPRLRLSDFGIAMRLGEPRLTEADLVVGTPGYLAPEQMRGAEPDFPADLFAVGLVALHLLEGARPDTKALVRYFTDHGTPGAPKGVPEPLWQVVATLLQPDPQARFRTATGARKALAAAAELLPEPGPDDEIIEIFDQVGPLPPGFGPHGPFVTAPGVTVTAGASGPGSRGVPSPAPERGAPGFGGPSGEGAPAAGAGDRAAGGAGSGGVGSGSAGSGGAGAAPPLPVGDGRARPDGGPDPRPGPSVTSPVWGTARPDTGAHRLPPPPGPVVENTPAPPLPYPRQETAGASPQAPGYPAFRPPQAPSRPAPAAPVPPEAHPRADAPTAPYTVQPYRVSPAAPALPRHRAARRRRTVPPAGVTVPVLLLALVCYAVGFWALSRL